MTLDPGAAEALGEVRAWLEANGIRRLNVAGPRESEAPGIYARARAFLALLFDAPATGGPAPA